MRAHATAHPDSSVTSAFDLVAPWRTQAPARPGLRQGPRARRYLDPYLRTVRLTDALVVALVVTFAQVTRFGLDDGRLAVLSATVGYPVAGAVLLLVWLALLHLNDTYDRRLVGHGVQEYRQVFQSSVWVFAALGLASFALQLDFARGYVVVAFPLGTVLLLAGRWTLRRWLVAERVRGELSDRVLLVGDSEHVAQLVGALRRTPGAGYRVIGACVNDADGPLVADVPVLGREEDVLAQAERQRVDVVAVSGSASLGSTGLRRLGWSLEGTDVDLVVAPAIMEVAGPRVLTRPVEGLPLLHVEPPTFSGPPLVIKGLIDRCGALLALLLLLPVMVVVAVLVKGHDRGPVFFHQERVGQDGRSFPMVKFRSMTVDAEERLVGLKAVNEGAGVLFKIKDDPRVTPIGRIIRRFSLDELPQLLNVLRGEMSLVGPRPPLPREVAEYANDTHRRLLVKPGMTGLWQISGRSDLSWEESVRLDLYYVENWTPVLDVMIMFRTLRVVTSRRGSGAY